jgi:hypothetical protein
MELESKESSYTYEDAKHGFRLVIPLGWMIINCPEAAVLIVASQLDSAGQTEDGEVPIANKHIRGDTFRTNVNVTCYSLPPSNVNLDMLVQKGLQEIKGFLEGFALESIDEIVLSFLPARKLVYLGKTHGHDVRLLQYVTVVNCVSYTVTLTASRTCNAKELTEGKSIIDSFELRGTKAAVLLAHGRAE